MDDKSSHALLALLDLSKALGSENGLDAILHVIVEKTSSVIDAERTSFFIFDESRGVLWTRVAQGLGGARIELPRGAGVAGDVAATMTVANVPDPYSDPRFSPEYDRRSGFHTRSLLAAPVIDSSGKLLGVVQSVNKIGSDRFDDRDESLMSAIASHVAVAMERATLTAAQVESERLSEALKVASDIQMQMLPPNAPVPHERFDLYAYLRPARMVGGDLYDYMVSGDRLYFCIGDVSGKGIGSALVMALAKTLFRANVPHYEDAAQLTEAVNVRLCEETGATMFVTAFCGFLDLTDGTLHFCNAGHDRPFLLRAGGSVEVMESKPGLALGVLPHFRYPLQQTTLARGDALLLYTDGITEATNAQEQLFGADRLRTVLVECAGADAERVVRGVVEAVEGFVEGAAQSDDLTMLCVRYR